MDEDVEFSEFLDTFEIYARNFGHSFTAIGLSPGMAEFDIAYIEMLRCLDGERTEPITAEELGLRGEGVYAD